MASAARFPTAISRETTARPDRLYKLGGVAFMVSGLLFFTKSVLESIMGPPPSSGPEILGWIAAQKPLLAITSEVLFFGVGALVPAVVALYVSLARTHRASAVLGCGILALTIPMLAVLLIVHGRLPYPMFHIEVRTPEVAELVVSTYFGGLHAVALLFALGTVVVSVAMRGVYGKAAAYLGFVTAAFDVLGSYPDRIGTSLWLVCGAFFAAWLVVVGARLYRMSEVAV